MSWSTVKLYIIDKGDVDVALCTNCGGLHYPAHLANGCFYRPLTEQELIEKYGKGLMECKCKACEKFKQKKDIKS